MRVGLVYDLREDYRAFGYSEQEIAEFDSKETVDSIDAALIRLGYKVTRIGRGQELAKRLTNGERFDLVFSIAEGLNGRSREAQVPSLCELFDQPYAFSDPLTMAATLDKAVAKRLVRDHGIPTAPFVVVECADIATTEITFPAFVKPLAEGTGKGCAGKSLVHSAEQLRIEAGRLIEKFRQPVIVECYLPGREFTVGIVGSGTDAKIIAVMEIAVSAAVDNGVYSFEIKEDWEPYVGLSIVNDGEARLAGERALAAYRALECRDAGRVDMKSDSHGAPQFLEVNPIAGLHPTHSDLPILASKAGWAYGELIAEIMTSACGRYAIKAPGNRAKVA